MHRHDAKIGTCEKALWLTCKFYVADVGSMRWWDDEVMKWQYKVAECDRNPPRARWLGGLQSLTSITPRGSGVRRSRYLGRVHLECSSTIFHEVIPLFLNRWVNHTLAQAHPNSTMSTDIPPCHQPTASVSIVQTRRRPLKSPPRHLTGLGERFIVILWLVNALFSPIKSVNEEFSANP